MSSRKTAMTKTGKVLEAVYKKYNHRDLIGDDPLRFIYQYSDPADMEIVGFLSSALAYGRVQQIGKSLTKLYDIMSPSPADFIAGFNKSRRKSLAGFKHRFNTGEDIADLCELLKKVLRKHQSLEKFFLLGYNESDKNIIPALSMFCDQLCDMYARSHDGKVSRGLMYLLASPSRKSACKRLNLFLRWMVRSDDVDPGLWKSVDQSKLIVPVDVHMARLCKILGFYCRKTVSLATAVEITENFAKILPADPVKYDFALSRIGIIESCSGKINDRCQLCQLLDYCMKLQQEKQ